MFISIQKTLSATRAVHVWPVILAAFAAALLITGSIYLLGTLSGVPLTYLSGDPASITKASVYLGILSNLGVIFWAGAASCAFLGAALQPRNTLRFWFLLASGVLTALLTLDDLLLFHEHVMPHYLHIPEGIGYLIYFLLIGTYLFGFLREIWTDTNFLILGVSLLFFGLSVIITRFFPYSQLVGFLKDSLKFFGIVYWLVYFFNTTVRFVRGEKRTPI